MSAKVYWLKFGSGDARTYSGLAPTFLQFFDSSGATITPPSISEIKYGGITLSGIYGFSYTIGITTQNSIYFLAYSATTLAIANDNYVTGILDPVLAADQQITSQGSTLVSIGNTMSTMNTYIGTTTSTFGTSSVDPSSVFGYLKRIQELLEGDQVFASSSGNWLLYNRASLGTTTLLRTKNVANNGSQILKSGV